MFVQTLTVTLVVVWIASALGAALYALLSSSYPWEKRLLFALGALAVPIVGAIAAFYLLSRKRAAPAPELSSETMSIDVLAAGTRDSAPRSDHDRQ
jgi:hypothetical protein